MTELGKRLRNDLELIRNTALWKRYQNEIQRAIEYYEKELRGNSKIGDSTTYGASWQEILRRLSKIANMMDSIIESVDKTPDGQISGTSDE